MHFQHTAFALGWLVLAASPALAADPTMAPIDRAHTFAQVRQGDRVHTLLALKLDAGKLAAIDLSAASGLHGEDAFDVIQRFDNAALDRLARQAQDVRSYPLERLLGVRAAWPGAYRGRHQLPGAWRRSRHA